MKHLSIVGKLNIFLLKNEFEKLKNEDVIITQKQIEHIQFGNHSSDFKYFEKYSNEVISNPDIILRDLNHRDTIMTIKKIENTNLNVIIALSIADENNIYQNSVITSYRIRDKNLRKLEIKHQLIYKKQ